MPFISIGAWQHYASKRKPLPLSQQHGLGMSESSLAAGSGSRLIPEARKQGRLVSSWAIKDDELMGSSIRQELDGVITDDPERFLELCDQRPRLKCGRVLPSKQ
ncbi:hypothetical protein M434DRAFT_33088 [Hypoxylon sp. CO27-5]|nr:hypothetical protein M434DRAFT_33088 [Hypoxylon sp. CO27-5]